MSNLYASIDADRSETLATRQGNKEMTIHIRGWDKGVRVHAKMSKNGTIFFFIEETGGSNNDKTIRDLGIVTS